MRKLFLFSAFGLTASIVVLATFVSLHFLWTVLIIGPLIAVGFLDFFQTRHALRRNFPVFGRLRYWAEILRPKINQYFIESNTDGVPFSREQRSVVYQRAKGELDSLPFGTQHDVYADGYEWVNHSLAPTQLNAKDLRTVIGGPQCAQPAPPRRHRDARRARLLRIDRLHRPQR